MEIKEPHIHGHVNFKSDLPIENIGEIISNKIFSGAVFAGKEKHIYEEVPAIYIDNLMLGFLFVIQGYSGIDNEIGYWLEMTPYFSISRDNEFEKTEKYDVNLNYYLYYLLIERLKDNIDIQIIEPE